MSNAAITVDLNARIAQFETELKRATGTLDNFGAKGNQVAAGLKSAFAGMAAGLSVGALAAFAKSGIDAADALNDMSQRTGVAVRTLAEYKLAATLADTSLDDLAKGIQRLTLTQGQAEQGGKAQAESLKRLGISSKDPKIAFEQLADAVAKSTDSTQLAADLNAVLGRSYVNLLPLLQGGAQGLRDSAAASESFAESMVKLAPDAARFNDQLDVMRINAAGAAASILSKLVPSLNEWIAVGREVVETGTLLDKIRFFGIGNASDEIVNRVRTMSAASAGWASSLKKSLAELNTPIPKLAEPPKKRASAGATSDPLASLLASTDIGKMEEFDKKVAQLNARFDSGRKSSELYTQAMTKLIETAFSGNFSQAMTERIANEKKLADEIDRTIDVLDERALAESDSFEALEDLIGGIELETEMIGMTNEAREEAIALRTLEAEGINLSADALDEYRKRLSAAMDSKQAAAAAKASAENAANEWQRASDNIERSLTDALMRGFEGGKDWASNFVGTLKNMFSTLVLRPLIEPLAKAGAGAVTGAMGMGSSGASAASGFSSGASMLGAAGNVASFAGSAGLFGSAAAGGVPVTSTLGAVASGAGYVGAGSTGLVGTAGAALAAVPVAGWVALGALAIWALTGPEPSDKSGWSEVDLSSGDVLGTGGLEGDKYSQENRDAAKAATDVGAAWASLLQDLGGEISGQLKIEIGDRDGMKADLNGDGAWDFIERDSEIFFDKLLDGLTESAVGLDDALTDMLVSFDGATEQLLEFAGALVAIRDYTSADLMTDALDQIEQAGRSTWQTWQAGNAELRTLTANFDGSLASATALADATSAQYQLELNLIGQIQGLLVSTNAMFGDSIEQIKLSNMDAAQQYDYWRAEVDKDYADLLAATDPAEIARLSGEVNQGSMNAYGLLEEDQQAALAPEFIAYLEGADTLTTERLNASQDAIVATHADLTASIESVINAAAEKMMEAAQINLAAAQTPVAVNVTVESTEIGNPMYEVGG